MGERSAFCHCFILFSALCPSRFAIILIGNIDLVALLQVVLSVSVLKLFLTLSLVGL